MKHNLRWWLRRREKKIFKNHKRRYRRRIYHLRETIFDWHSTLPNYAFCPGDLLLWSWKSGGRKFSELWTGGISGPGLDIKDKGPNEYGWCTYCWTDEQGRPHWGHPENCGCGACEHQRVEAIER